MYHSRIPLLAAAIAFTLFAAGAAAAPRVVASIPPVHSLVAAVMQGVGAPTLLIPPGASPHTYALRPSDARALARADAVFWVGPGLATFLRGPLGAIASRARIVTLQQTAGVRLLPYRGELLWAQHGHGSQRRHAGHEDPGDGIGLSDMHIWLDPDNASAMVDAIATALAAVDPAHTALYADNADRLKARIEAMDARLRELLAPVSEQPYLVFHDAYQYFERHYGLSPVGAITVSPELRPGAGHLAAIRDRMEQAGAVCVFAEPQFDPDIVTTLIQGTGVRRGTLDPLGVALSPGPDLYFRLMERLAAHLRSCLED